MSLTNTPLRIKPHIKEILRSTNEVDTSKQSTNETRFTSTDQFYLTDLEYIKCAEEHFDKVYEYLNETRDKMKDYRREISDLRSEIIDMKHQVQMQSDFNSSNFKPGCERLWKLIQMYSPQNEVDTVYLKQQVNNLNRDKQQLQQQIIASQQKIEQMERQIGLYRLNTDYTNTQ